MTSPAPVSTQGKRRVRDVRRMRSEVRTFGEMFIPAAIFRSHLDSFTLRDRKKKATLALGVYFGVPLGLTITSGVMGWSFLDGLTASLLTAVALVGTVLVAVSAVLIQSAGELAQEQDASTVRDIRRATRLRQVHGTVMYGSLISFALAGLLIWHQAAPADGVTASILDALSLGLTAHLGLTLLRVLVVADVVMEGLSKRAANRAA